MSGYIPKRLRVMAEYGSSGIWIAEPHGSFRHGMIEHRRLGLPSGLASGFDAWIERYWARATDDPFDVAAFNLEGRRLSVALKRLVGPETEVIFEPEREDGGPGSPELIRVTDGPLVMDEVSPDELADAADTNMVVHCGWAQRRTPGMRVIETSELVVVDSGLPCDTFNLVCRARLEAGTALERVREVVDQFTGAGRPFSWWVGPVDRPTDLGELLCAAGLRPAEMELAMAADLRSLPEGDPSPEDVTIRRVETREDLRTFAEIVAANWNPSDPDVLRLYETGATALLDVASPLRFYVGSLRGVPVATCELTVGGGVAGIYNVCTLADYRRRGIGAALTRAALREARSIGYRTAILQASDDGARIYRRLGFREFGRITEYKPSSAGEAEALGTDGP